MEFRNAVFDKSGTITCDINHPQFGWIPFTASPHEEGTSSIVFEAAKATAKPYVPLSPQETLEQWRNFIFVSRAEFCIECESAGILSEADAEKSAMGGWPDAFNVAVAALPFADRIREKASFSENNMIGRNSTLLRLLVDAGLVTPEQLDMMCGWDDYEEGL